jgi:hypothetical protein
MIAKLEVGQWLYRARDNKEIGAYEITKIGRLYYHINYSGFKVQVRKSDLKFHRFEQQKVIRYGGIQFYRTAEEIKI